MVVAADPVSAAELTSLARPVMNGLSTWWFDADQVGAHPHFLRVDGGGPGHGPVVNSAVMTAAAPTYAPPGRHLVAATTLLPSAATESAVRRHLSELHGRDHAGGSSSCDTRSRRAAGPTFATAAASTHPTRRADLRDGRSPGHGLDPGRPGVGLSRCGCGGATVGRQMSRDFDPQGPPLPSRQVMSQWWCDISFLHWRVDAGRWSRRCCLPGTRPDVFDGSSLGGTDPVPDGRTARWAARRPVRPFGTFLETNVRLYSVDDAGRHGVVFRSLEADRLCRGRGRPGCLRRALHVGSDVRAPDRPGTRSGGPSRSPTGPDAALARGPRAGLDVEVGPERDPMALRPVSSPHGRCAHTSFAGHSWWVP